MDHNAASDLPRGVTPPSGRGGRFLSDVIIELGFAEREAVEQALESSRAPGKKLGTTLVEMGILSEDELGRAVAERYRLDHLDLSVFDVDPEAVSVIGEAEMRRYDAVPVAFTDDGALVVAMVDPADWLAAEEIAQITRRRVRRAVASASAVTQVIDHATSGGASPAEADDDASAGGHDALPSRLSLRKVSNPLMGPSAPPTPASGVTPQAEPAIDPGTAAEPLGAGGATADSPVAPADPVEAEAPETDTADSSQPDAPAPADEPVFQAIDFGSSGLVISSEAQADEAVSSPHDSADAGGEGMGEPNDEGTAGIGSEVADDASDPADDASDPAEDASDQASADATAALSVETPVEAHSPTSAGSDAPAPEAEESAPLDAVPGPAQAPAATDSQRDAVLARAELEAGRGELERVRSELASTRAELASTRSELTSARGRLDSALKRAADAERETGEARAEVSRLEAQLGAANEKADTLRDDVTWARQQIEHKDEREDQALADLRARIEAMSGWRVSSVETVSAAPSAQPEEGDGEEQTAPTPAAEPAISASDAEASDALAPEVSPDAAGAQLEAPSDAPDAAPSTAEPDTPTAPDDTALDAPEPAIARTGAPPSTDADATGLPSASVSAAHSNGRPAPELPDIDNGTTKARGLKRLIAAVRRL